MAARKEGTVRYTAVARRATWLVRLALRIAVAAASLGTGAALALTTISPPVLSNGTVGTAYTQGLSSSGSIGPYTYSIVSGTLPAGISLFGSGLLSGTPLVSGSSTFNIRSTPLSGPAGFRTYTLTINGPPASGAVSATVASNSTNNPITLALSGLAATSVAVATAASHGTATASGTSITYTPTVGYAGADSFTYTATNGFGTSSPATVTITVSGPTIALSPASLPGGTSGTAYSQTIAASGGAAPYTYAITSGALPSGITLSAAGVLGGTPTASGPFSFTVTATDANAFSGSGTYNWTIAVAPPVAGATSATVASGSSNNPITPVLSGGAATSVAVATAASHGTATASGTSITYTPTVGYAGADSFTYTATNGSGTSSPATVTITVTAPTIAISPASLVSGTSGTAYSQTVAASGGAAPYTYAITAGALPSGITLNASSGVVGGTPTVAGSFGFTVAATDANAFAGSRAYALTINVAAPVAGPSSATVTTNTTNAPITLNLTGGVATGVAVATAPGHGAAVASGTSINYTPTTGYAGADSFTYTATNAGGTSAPATVTITVASPTITVIPATLAAATSGTAFSQTFSSSGGTAPYSYGLAGGALPAGMTLGASGVLTGTPTTAGSFAFTVVATDALANAGSRSYTLTVNPALPVTGAVTASVTANSGTNAITAVLSGGPASSVAIAGAAAHGTATANGTGLAYAPAAGYSGADSFTYVASNVTGTSAPSTVTITVTAVTVTVDPATLPVAIVGTAFAQSAAASGGIAPYTYAIGSGTLPAGLTLTTAGALGGTPSASGTFPVTIVATDAHGNIGSRAYAWVVRAATATPQPFAQTIAANALRSPLRLPLAGLNATAVSLQSAPSHGTAVVQGLDILYTPSSGYVGGDAFTYVVTAPAGTSDPASVTLTVSPLAMTIAPAALPYAPTNRAVDVSLQATGGASPYRFAIAAGTLPPGIAMSTEGLLSGIPTTGGSFAFTVVAVDANGVQQNREYLMAVGAVLRSDPSTDRGVAAIVAAQISATDRFASALIDNVVRHLDRGANASDVCHDLLAVGSSAAERSRDDATADRRRSDDDARNAADEPACLAGVPLWVEGSIQYGRLSPTDRVTNGFSTSGVTFGVDGPTFAGIRWGAALDYGRDRADAIDTTTTATSRGRAVMASLYGRMNPRPWFFVDGMVGAGRLSFASRRVVADDGSTASGDRNGRTWLGSIRIGSEIRLGAATLVPSLRADVKTARLDAFGERGSDLALTYESMHWSTRAVTAGARGSWNLPTRLGIVSPHVNLDVRHASASRQDQDLYYTDLGAASQTWRLTTTATPQNSATVTAGVQLRIRDGLVIDADASQSYGSAGQRQRGARVGLQFAM